MSEQTPIDDGGPAFPALDVEHFPAGYGHGESTEVTGRSGMSLLDYFAGQALPQAIAHELQIRAGEIQRGTFRFEAIARAAYMMADAMIAERTRRQDTV